MIQGRCSLRIGVRPHDNTNTEINTPLFSGEKVGRELNDISGLPEVLKKAHARMEVDESKPEYPKVTFLGTGSSKPGKYRSTSFILVETHPNSFVILDCGEGNNG